MEASLRKVLISVLSVLLLAFLVGCQESDSGDSSGDSSSDSAEQQQALEEAQREVIRNPVEGLLLEDEGSREALRSLRE
jgi:ABC-type oligopeptide transport system substrate-binding subunit